MGQKSSGNEHLYKEIVSELVKSFTYLGETIITYKFVIENAPKVKKLMDKDLVRFNEGMAGLNTSIDVFNDGIKNVVTFIRTSELGELEDIALYLEKCVVPDFFEQISNSSWMESKDVKTFQKNLSLENISRMLTDITDIAYNDQNPEFLRYFSKSKLVS